MDSAQPIISQKDLSFILEALKLEDDSEGSLQNSNVVIVALDVENHSNAENIKLGQSCKFQIGFAILQLNQIHLLPPSDLITVYNFALGCPSYISHVSQAFLFGETVSTSATQLVDSISAVIPRDRKIIYVGHSVHNDIDALSLLGYEFPDRNLATVDTFLVAKDMFGMWECSLFDLLNHLQCPHQNLHVAGNDARFTMNALMHLIVEKCTKQGLQKDIDCEILDIFLQAGNYVKLPLKVHVPRARSRQQRKHQERLRKRERQQAQQETVREARRLKRCQENREAAIKDHGSRNSSLSTNP